VYAGYEPRVMLRLSSEGEGDGAEAAWLRRFHEGDRDLIEQLYREHFETVARAAALLVPADRETVIHEVFLRLLTQAPLRASFRGGAFGAWLTVVSRNHALDCLRRRNREIPTGVRPPAGGEESAATESSLQARLLVDRFRKEILPAKWSAVFQARFLDQLNQSEAASSLGMSRTTLAYQEARVRRLLRKFLLKGTT
jgi:RNA polymerase sigma-70 factor (ECF subfamily)